MAPNASQTRWESAEIRMQRGVNKWGARVIPVILIALVGYSAWVFVVLLALNHLIRAGNGKAAGIAYIIVYFVLLVPMAISYFRVLQVVATNPGYVPLPPSDRRMLEKSRRRNEGSNTASDSTINSRLTNSTTNTAQQNGYLNRGSISGGRSGPPPGLEKYYMRDIFESQVDGIPRWCSSCQNFKPDRAHHSSEVDRCTYKMDHYCPWAGGMVSETNFKFFVQFLFYGALFCAFVLGVTIYYVVEMGRQNQYNVDFIVVVALSGLFFLFSAGMFYSSLFATLMNVTTTDNLINRTKVHYFAVLIPPQLQHRATQLQPGTQPSHLPPHPATAPTMLQQAHLPTQPQPQSMAPPPRYITITYPLPTASDSQQHMSTTAPRTFAVLSTPPGKNPYRLRSSAENMKTVMGNSVVKWFLPIKYSPCWDGGHGNSRNGRGAEEKNVGGNGGHRPLMYPLGPVVEKMILDAGLDVPMEMWRR